MDACRYVLGGFSIFERCYSLGVAQNDTGLRVRRSPPGGDCGAVGQSTAVIAGSEGTEGVCYCEDVTVAGW